MWYRGIHNFVCLYIFIINSALMLWHKSIIFLLLSLLFYLLVQRCMVLMLLLSILVFLYLMKLAFSHLTELNLLGIRLLFYHLHPLFSIFLLNLILKTLHGLHFCSQIFPLLVVLSPLILIIPLLGSLLVNLLIPLWNRTLILCQNIWNVYLLLFIFFLILLEVVKELLPILFILHWLVLF
jgi:hypothetical protein